MIIKQKDVTKEDFFLLVNYLSASDERDQNCLMVEDVDTDDASSIGVRAGEGEMFTLVYGSNLSFDTGYHPFARLLTARPSYNDDDELMFAVEIEIPDYVHIGVVDVDDTNKVKSSTQKSLIHGCSVISNRFATEITDIVKGVTRTRMKKETAVE